MYKVVATHAPKTGLVLSGGGAKGAYQVGVLKALHELGANVDMVAGASMGALNGAVLASAPSVPEGIQRLEKLWKILAAQSPVEANVPAYLKLLAAAGLTLGIPLSGVLARTPMMLQSLGKLVLSVTNKLPGVAKMPSIASASEILDISLMADGPLKELFDEYLDMQGLMHGLPLYVSVFESQGGLADLFGCLSAEAGLKDTAPSTFLHVQTLPEQERRNALLASAAIPLLYQARQIGNARYSDGGQGGWQTSQGNTPITPLIKAGCKQVIVTHLTDGTLWSRHDFPDTTILEIRPLTPITAEDGPLAAAKAALGFDSSNISRLMDQGYQDTLRCIGRVMKAYKARQDLKDSERTLEKSLQNGHHADVALADAMSRLR